MNVYTHTPTPQDSIIEGLSAADSKMLMVRACLDARCLMLTHALHVHTPLLIDYYSSPFTPPPTTAENRGAHR